MDDEKVQDKTANGSAKLTDAEFYKHKYLAECIARRRERIDFLRQQLMDADSELGKLSYEHSTLITELATRYSIDKSRCIITEDQYIMVQPEPTQALQRR